MRRHLLFCICLMLSIGCKPRLLVEEFLDGKTAGRNVSALVDDPKVDIIRPGLAEYRIEKQQANVYIVRLKYDESEKVEFVRIEILHGRVWKMNRQDDATLGPTR